VNSPASAAARNWLRHGRGAPADEASHSRHWIVHDPDDADRSIERHRAKTARFVHSRRPNGERNNP
jgi:hypothetical protein